MTQKSAVAVYLASCAINILLLWFGTRHIIWRIRTRPDRMRQALEREGLL